MLTPAIPPPSLHPSRSYALLAHVILLLARSLASRTMPKAGAVGASMALGPPLLPCYHSRIFESSKTGRGGLTHVSVPISLLPPSSLPSSVVTHRSTALASSYGQHASWLVFLFASYTCHAVSSPQGALHAIAAVLQPPHYADASRTEGRAASLRPATLASCRASRGKLLCDAVRRAARLCDFHLISAHIPVRSTGQAASPLTLLSGGGERAGQVWSPRPSQLYVSPPSRRSGGFSVCLRFTRSRHCSLAR